MRILHLIADVDRASGGPAAAVVGMAAAVARGGHRVEIMATDFVRRGSTLVEVPSEAPTQLTLHPVWPPRFWKPSPRLWWDLRRRVETFDLVHVHSLYLFHSTVGPALCRSRGVPYVVRPHGTLDPVQWHRRRGRKAVMERLFETRNLSRAAAIHFTHARERDLACLAVSAPSFVCPLGIDSGAYRQIAEPETRHRRGRRFRTRWSLGDEPIVLFLGRLTKRKGAHLALAARATTAPAQRWTLVLAGADSQGLAPGPATAAERVRVTGLLDEEQKQDALAAADLLVAPSGGDNFGLAILEALAAGLPPIVSSQVALGDEIASSGAGWVVGLETADAAATLAAAIEDALADHADRQRRSVRALELAAGYDWDVIGARLTAEYAAIVERGAAP